MNLQENWQCRTEILYQRMILPRLMGADKVSVCLACYGVPKSKFNESKDKIDSILPDGWTTKWSNKSGILIFLKDGSK